MDAFIIRTPRISDKNSKKSSQSCSSSTTLSSITKEELNIGRYSIGDSNSSLAFGGNSSSTPSNEVGALNKIKPDRRQRKLSDLGGVVVIEKIKEYVRKLEDPKIPLAAKVSN